MASGKGHILYMGEVFNYRTQCRSQLEAGEGMWDRGGVGRQSLTKTGHSDGAVCVCSGETVVFRRTGGRGGDTSFWPHASSQTSVTPTGRELKRPLKFATGGGGREVFEGQLGGWGGRRFIFILEMGCGWGGEWDYSKWWKRRRRRKRLADQGV